MKELDPNQYKEINAIQGPTKGMAVEPDGGHLWICSGANTQEVKVNRVAIDGKYASEAIVLKKKGNHVHSPYYVALQTAANKVEQVWVTTYGSGTDKLFYFKPDDKGTVNAVEGFKDNDDIRDILWDSSSKLLWVTIDDIGLCAVDPATHKILDKYHVDAPKIRRIALSKLRNGTSRIWYTFNNGTAYQVGFYDQAQNKNVSIPDALLQLKDSPFSLTVSKDNTKVWLVTTSGKMFSITHADDDVTKMAFIEGAALPYSAQQMVRDDNDYLWIAIPEDGGHSALVQCLPDGKVKGKYALTNTNFAYDIAYVNTPTTPDTFFITDKTAGPSQSGLHSFRPLDWIEPNVIQNLSIKPPAVLIETESGQEFDPWSFTVLQNGEQLKKDVNLDLVVSDDNLGKFESVKGNRTALSGSTQAHAMVSHNGEVSVDNLYADGKNGNTFAVIAIIRGINTPIQVASAGIYAPVNRIDFKDKGPIAVHVNKHSHALQMTITTDKGQNLGKRAVTFTSSAEFFLDEKNGRSRVEYTDDNGDAMITLYAGPTPNQQSALTAKCGKVSQKIAVNLRPLPLSITFPETTNWSGKKNAIATKPFTIKLNNAGAGETVELAFTGYGINKDVYVWDNHTQQALNENELAGKFVTDSNGQIVLGNDSSYGIVCNQKADLMTVTANCRLEDSLLTQTQTYNVVE